MTHKLNSFIAVCRPNEEIGMEDDSKVDRMLIPEIFWFFSLL